MGSIDDDGMNEMFVKVADEFGDASVERRRHGDVVEHREVLDELAQADAAGVRTDRHAELGGHQNLANARSTTTMSGSM